jgi:Iodothyronine deiodinase
VDLHRIYDTYKDRANFLTIYISEAHPDDEWQMDSNRKDAMVYKQPKSDDERQAMAKILVDRLKYRIPVALDPIDGRAEKAFAAWPERIYVIGRDGRIVFKGGMGPFGFKPEKAEAALAQAVSSPASRAGG